MVLWLCVFVFGEAAVFGEGSRGCVDASASQVRGRTKQKTTPALTNNNYRDEDYSNMNNDLIVVIFISSLKYDDDKNTNNKQMKILNATE